MPPLAEAPQSAAVPRVGPAQSRAGVGLCDLPMDIWEHLFRRSGLSIVELVRLSVVCRTLRDVARRYAVIAHACAYLHSCVIGSPRIAQCRAHEHDRFIALTQCIAQNHHQFCHTSTAAIYHSPPLLIYTLPRPPCMQRDCNPSKRRTRHRHRRPWAPLRDPRVAFHVRSPTVAIAGRVCRLCSVAKRAVCADDIASRGDTRQRV
jgi:hypothetical protein